MKQIRTILNGPLGAGLKLSCAERLKKVDYKYMTEPFRLRNEDDGAWRCEFWGKIVRSAITAAVIADNSELKNILKQTVSNIMATQTSDGCISSYPAELQLNGWDVWGRKYVLLALIRYYEMLDRDPAVLDCCCRMLDHLMTQVGQADGKRSILACGLHSGLAAASILARDGFLRGMVIGALAGAAAEAVMLTCDKSMKAQATRTMRTMGKMKRQGALPAGYQKNWKKAVVKLSADSKDIELFQDMV